MNGFALFMKNRDGRIAGYGAYIDKQYDRVRVLK